MWLLKWRWGLNEEKHGKGLVLRFIPFKTMHSFKALGISSSLLSATIIIKFQQSVAGSRNGPVLDQASTAFLSLMFDLLCSLTFMFTSFLFLATFGFHPFWLAACLDGPPPLVNALASSALSLSALSAVVWNPVFPGPRGPNSVLWPHCPGHLSGCAS